MTLWVVLSAKRVSERLAHMVDNGELASAISLSQAIDTFIGKLQNFCQLHGGAMPIAIYERVVMNLPVNAMEQVPELIKQYNRELHGYLFAGIGMNMSEATAASRMSSYTGDIELFDPRKDYPSDYLYKSEKSEPHQLSMDLPPNLFDSAPADSDTPNKQVPVDDSFRLPSKAMKAKQKKPPVLAPGADVESQNSSKLIQSVMQELGFQPPPSPEEMQQQGPPRDLLEMLNGGQVPGYNPPQPEQEGQKSATAQDVDPKAIDAEVAEAEADAEKTNVKLARLLANVREQIPSIMQLHDTNPNAFKQSMNLISKLVSFASKRDRTAKSEANLVAEAIEKAVRRHEGYKSPGGRVTQNYPIGTRIQRKRKILASGKATWRSMASGQVKDAQGEPVSVKSSNNSATNEEK